MHRRIKSSKFTNITRKNCEKMSLHNITKDNLFAKKRKSLESINATLHILSILTYESKFLFDRIMNLKAIDIIKNYKIKKDVCEMKRSRKRCASSNIDLFYFREKFKMQFIYREIFIVVIVILLSNLIKIVTNDVFIRHFVI